MSLAQIAEIRQGTRQAVSQPQALQLVDKLKLTLRRASASPLVGKLGVHQSVHVVFNRLHGAHILDILDATSRAHDMQKVAHILGTLNVHGVARPATVHACMDPHLADQLRQSVGKALARHRDLEVKVPTGVCHKAAGD